MKIFPAIDLKDNKCVRLSRGNETTSVVFSENPVLQASYFEEQGCARLHLIDLDAAFGRKNVNSNTIKKIRKAIKIPIQIGGGIRNTDDVKRLIDLEMSYLIIGSFSITNIETVKDLAEKYRDKIYIALDIFNNNIMINGWKKESHLSSANVFNFYNDTQIRGYVLTDINNDGMLSGLNISMIKENLKLTSKKLIVGGGLGAYKDLENLKKISKINLEGVIAGKSYYVGNINLKKAQLLLNENA